MGSCPPKNQFETVGGSHHGSPTNADIAILQVRPKVHAEHHVDFWVIEDSIGNHERCSPIRRRFFGRLKHELDSSTPGITIFLERGRRAEKHGHVAVVAAGVHNAIIS